MVTRGWCGVTNDFVMFWAPFLVSRSEINPKYTDTAPKSNFHLKENI